MRSLAALLLGALIWTACSVAGPVASAVATPEQAAQVGRNFTLRPGGSAVHGDLRMDFEGVLADSRCPKGERCVTAGSATVRIGLQRGKASRAAHELRLTAEGGQAAQAGDFEVQLLRLEPYPVANRAIAPADYVLTLVLRQGMPGTATR